MNWAVVQSGAVINIVIWDGETQWVAPNDSELIQINIDQRCGIGWTWDGTSFSEPVE